MTSSIRLLTALVLLTGLQVVAVEASDQQIVYIRNTCECWSTDLKCVCKIESDPTSVRPLMQRLVNRTAEYYWQDVEFQSMVYDRTTFILANTFADGPFPSGITFKGDFSIVNDSFNHLNMTLNKVELNFETFSGRKPKFSKQYWRYIFDHGEGTLRTLRIIKYQIEDFIIPNYLGAALTQEVRPLTEFKVVGCEVKEVKERAFKNFTQLEVLDLSDNHLTTLPENVFSRNINLQKILLANNQISFLTKTIFDGLPNLLLINLRKNKLTAVPAIPRHTNRRFQPMVYLMADNSIHCRCSLIWVLHELTFHHNLEIEATCSDPTMVRGMPIIEGFTRMDKEACYRLIRKEDDSGDLSANSEIDAAQSTKALAGPLGDKAGSFGPAIVENLSAKKAPMEIRDDSTNAKESIKEPVKEPMAAPNEKQSHEPYVQEPIQKGQENFPQQSVQTAIREVSQPQKQDASVKSSQPVPGSTLNSLLSAKSQAPVQKVTQVEPQAQAVAPQAPVSGSDATLAISGSSPGQPITAPSQTAQLLNFAQQTILSPSQSVVVSPINAVPPQHSLEASTAVAAEMTAPAGSSEKQSAIAPTGASAASVASKFR